MPTAISHCDPHARVRCSAFADHVGQGSGRGAPPSAYVRFADEPPPRWAEIGPDEVVPLIAVISPTNGPILGERARGATLCRGDLVLVSIADESWIGVVRRVSLRRGALVEEILSHS